MALAVSLPVAMEAAMSERHDAVVIGAGPAGGAAALLLARAGWSVEGDHKRQITVCAGVHQCVPTASSWVFTPAG